MKYTTDERQNKLKKIQAALAIANCKTAPDGEREAALAMAQKLADKYGFKIQQGPVEKPKAQTFDFDTFVRDWTRRQAEHGNHWYAFSPKQAYTKILKVMYKMMQKAGFRCYMMKDGKKVIGISYEAQMHDVNKDLAKIYKELCKHCDAFKKQIKADGYSWYSGNELTDKWCTIMEDATYEFDYSHCSQYDQEAFKFGTSIVDKLTKVKEGF